MTGGGRDCGGGSAGADQRGNSPSAGVGESAGATVGEPPLGLLGRLLEGALELDPEGRPEHFFQSGWRIVYRRYVSVRDIALPERLDFERARLEARLVVGRWNFEV